LKDEPKSFLRKNGFHRIIEENLRQNWKRDDRAEGRKVVGSDRGDRRDPGFGPVMMFGLGGNYVELFKDIAFRVHT
jgi:acyl-CoA synthetase (NDP forming)